MDLRKPTPRGRNVGNDLHAAQRSQTLGSCLVACLAIAAAAPGEWGCRCVITRLGLRWLPRHDGIRFEALNLGRCILRPWPIAPLGSWHYLSN